MVIFTEHNEVIMSIDDMRDMIRYAIFHSHNCDGPVSFIEEGLVKHIEAYSRKDPYFFNKMRANDNVKAK